MANEFPYVWRWAESVGLPSLPGRKGTRCRNGFRAVVSRNGLRRAAVNEKETGVVVWETKVEGGAIALLRTFEGLYRVTVSAPKSTVEFPIDVLVGLANAKVQDQWLQTRERVW